MVISKICYGPGVFFRTFEERKICLSDYKKNNRKELMKFRTLSNVMKSHNRVLIDTSSAYGKAHINIGNIQMENKTICTKLSAREQIIYGSNIRKAYYNAICQLKIDKADLYLMHWPVEKNYLDVWKQMEEMYEQGIVGGIGVCNCSARQLDKLVSIAKINPVVNQIECHPLFTREEERKICAENGIAVMSYTPLAREDDRIINNKRLNLFAKKNNKTVSQIILRWHIENNLIPVVSTSSIAHFQENIDVFDFELTEREVKYIDSLNLNSRLRYDSEKCDFVNL